MSTVDALDVPLLRRYIRELQKQLHWKIGKSEAATTVGGLWSRACLALLEIFAISASALLAIRLAALSTFARVVMLR